MRQLLCYAVAAVMAILAWTADAATPADPPAKKKTYKKKTNAAKTAPHKATTATKGSPAKKKSGTAAKSSPAKKGSPARKGVSKKGPAKKTTWRNRQLTPTPDRYKEIQHALVAKGYLQPEEVTGTWTPASADALKKFQSAQNLESSGKINSLSLIALGLGPKHDAAPPKPAEGPQ